MVTEADRKNWLPYGDVYNAIVNAIRNDYAALDQVREHNIPQLAAGVARYNSRYFHGDDNNFLRLVRLYLKVLGDPNLKLWKADPETIRDWSCGFSVRAQEDALYVTQCFGETRMEPGDRIVRIDDIPLQEFRDSFRASALYGQIPEREMWGYFVKYAVTLTAEKQDGSETQILKPDHFPVTDEDIETMWRPMEPRSGRAAFSAEAPGVCRLTLEHLEDPDAIYSVVEDHEAEIAGADVFLLDLRRCRGGDLSAVLALVSFLIDRSTLAADLFPDKGLYVKYTVHNRRRVPGLGADHPDVSGFYWEPHAYLNDLDIELEPEAGPQKIFILSDLYCRDEAETILKMASGLPKVTVIGRPSMGSSDYQAPMTISFEDDLFFSYPIAETKDAYEGKGIFGKGAPVDVYVPWTPAECHEDVILQKALELAQKD